MSIGRRRKGAKRLVLWGLAACALGGALLPSWASPAGPDAETRAALDRAVRFLQTAQNPDGGFGGRVEGPSDPDFSAWVAYALAAAGINPLDQALPGGADAHTYLTSHTGGLTETTDFDRAALVALSAGTPPHSFGSVDPIAAMLARRLPNGSFAQFAGSDQGWVNATVWSIFPLSAIEDPASRSIVTEATQWLIAQQHSDGAWSWGPAGDGARPDADTTGAAIQALNAAGVHDSEAERRAFDFLRAVQGPDGGFRAEPGAPTNSATTAWVVQAMWAAGEDPRAWQTAGGADPLSFLASLQRPDGSVGWTAGDDTNTLWMTAQVGPALAGLSYPLPAVPRAQAAPERDDAPAGQDEALNPAAVRGRSGRTVQRGDGVLAGGGGNGADLFSAPRPQSGGATAGGARQVDAAPLSLPEPDRSQPAPQAERQSGGSGGASGKAGRAGATPGAGTVEGVLVAARGAPAAPGLFGATQGGSSGARLALLLAAAMLAAAGGGARRERAGSAVA